MNDQIRKNGFSIRMVEVDNQILRIGEQKRGGKRPLLLFNGFGAPLETAAIFSHTLRNTDTLTFDIPGIGGSPATLCPYRLSHLTRLTVRLLDRLGYEAVDVLGISWGGGLAQQFAKDFPERCRKLVLVVTSTGAVMVPGKPSALLKLVSRDHFRDSERMIRFFRDLEGVGNGGEKVGINMPFQRFESGEFRGQLYQLLASWGWTSIHWLHRIKQPTLVLSGKKDAIVPPINGKILAKMIPNASLHILNGGHLFLMNKPDTAADLIEDFLRGESESQLDDR